MGEIPLRRIAGLLAVAAVIALLGWNSLRTEGGRDPGPLDRIAASPPGAGTSPRPGAAGSGDGFGIGAGASRIVIDVSGAVRRPGVYRFEHGMRVIDAIRRAGGATRDAFASAINRAALLSDGQQVVVPSRSAAPGAGAAGTAAGQSASPDADLPISLGSATQEQLEQIDGIGPVTAQSIIEFRDSQGGVSSVDELDQVSGIGPVTMEALRARLQP